MTMERPQNRHSPGEKHLSGRKIGLRLGILGVVAALAVGTGVGLWQYEHNKVDKSYDVLVVGSGPGGIAAAIQAARMGEHVAVLEETDWVGGQMTAADVGTMDEGNPAVRKSGIYGEFVQRATDYYRSRGKSMGTCYFATNTLCVDPHDGQVILRQMLGQEGNNLTLYTGTHVSDVIKQNNTVVGVRANGKRFDSKVLIDSEQYGDVLAQASARYRVGNTLSDAPNASPNACVQDITYSPVMKYYPNGVPTSLVIKTPPPGYDPEVLKRFAKVLTKDGHGLVVEAGKLKLQGDPLAFPAYASYRGLPDLSNPADADALQQDGHFITRTALNLGNDYPLNGRLSTKYLTDLSFRAHSNAQAELLSLQLIYYIQHDLGFTNWSIANDEGYDQNYNKTHHYPELKGYEAFEDLMPQLPYVREGRRAVGEYTLSGKDLYSSQTDPKHIVPRADSVAVGYYAMDLHDCRFPASLEGGLDDTSYIREYKGGPYEVPIGTLIPQGMNGLLVTDNNISVSREANGATRVQPTAMAIGQAAGALAALSIHNHEQPHSVNVSEVRTALLNAHAVVGVHS
ncbi:MAG TPA: FAD-dependent oxidoreductase [Candidatus Saccharimonadales bacterium]|nr:FAD-dependent oxidoreductase [Candidatus Saccharimonadales bacterium]